MVFILFVHTYSITPQVQIQCDNGDNVVIVNYIIIMTTVKIIVHTRCILFQNILVSWMQLYIFFHFFPVSPPIGQ